MTAAKANKQQAAAAAAAIPGAPLLHNGKPVPPNSSRYGGDTGLQSGDAWPYWLRVLIGAVTTVNFVVFWAVPIFGQGMLWQKLLRPFLRPVYNAMERFGPLRAVAAKYIYTRPQHADYFAQTLLVFLSWFTTLCYVIHAQATTGTLTWWQVYLYYAMWVGIRGGTLGGAYSLAHREGHNPSFYQPWIANSIGNLFENWVGPFFGNVPYNFSTSHIYLHHALNGGSQDSFYQFDMDRTSWRDFMVFLHRIVLHCLGISSVLIMYKRNLAAQWKKLAWGMAVYFIVVPALLLALTGGSFSFLFFIYVQPFVGMTFFLAFMNFAFHAFVDYDEHGKSIGCVNSTCIIDGDDDYFGEDDHMAHHYATHVYWRDLPAHRATKTEDFKQHHASVFRGLSIVELAALILFKQWDLLADVFVQFNDAPAKNKPSESELLAAAQVDLSSTTIPSKWSGTGKLTKEEVKAMLKQRAIRREPMDA